MKINSKIAYSVLIVAGIIIIGAGIYYVVANNENNQNNKENMENKVLSEITYIEGKIVNLFNKMNQVEYENYKISVENIEESSSNESSENSSNGSSEKSQTSENNSSENDSGSQSSSDSENKSSQNSQSTQEKQNNQKYTLQKIGILTEEQKIEWDNVKIEIESLYTSLPTITLDLYRTDIDQNDILNFNAEIDNLTIAIKEESKEKTLDELVKVYDYIVKFIKQSTNEQMKIVIIETKQNVLKAYSKLDSENWNSITQDVQTAIDVFSKLLTDVKTSEGNQYMSNKTYIMLNELKNAVEKQDVEVFLIKYEKLLEELRQI